MGATTISTVQGRRVWNSRGGPAVEAEVRLVGGGIGRAMATGAGEAEELSTQQAAALIDTEIAGLLIGRDAVGQTEIDFALIALDGTPNKGRLGLPALFATSQAVLLAQASQRRVAPWQLLTGDGTVRLPLGQVEIFGGGGDTGRRVDLKEFLVVCPGAASLSEALDWASKVWRTAGRLLAEAGRLFGVGDKGGHWPAFDSNEQALDFLARAIEQAGFRPVEDVAIALNVGASGFGRRGRYSLGLEGRILETGDLVRLLYGWTGRYPIVSIEDPLAADDPIGFVALTAATRGRVQIVGGDLFGSRTETIAAAAAARQVTAVAIRPDQAGTISEVRAALLVAQRAGLATVLSTRSADSEDTLIAHLAAGWDAGQIKIGAIGRGERTAKWNELLRIETALGARAGFSGRAALATT